MPQSRREFLCNCGLTMGGIALAFDRFGVINALAQSADYKALVCVFLNGGNDSNNIIIPYDNYAEYVAVRSNNASLNIPQNRLRIISPPSAGAQYGLHPALGDAAAGTGLHALWAAGKLAAVVNVGPLVQPLTRAEYLARPDLRPRSLFSHSDQQSQWQTSLSDQVSATGWGGRTADKAAHYNPANVRFPMMVTVSGVTIFSTGDSQRSLAFAPGSPFRFEGFSTNPPENDPRFQAMRQLLAADQFASATLVRSAAITMDQAVENARELVNVDTINVGTFPNTSLGNQLLRVARLIKLNRQAPSLLLNRQLFFCQLGGFDLHNAQASATDATLGSHTNLWTQVSNGMKAFYDFTEREGIQDNVVTFTLSDFARTFKPNANVGTDHGWGSHQFVMGGAVRGGDFYGQFQPLVLGAEQDTDSGAAARGRWIPTTAVDQYGATLATWYGVDPYDLPAVFPNLSHFSTPNLGFV
jgi:uncharacterized protein (DUF1501 family)